MTDRPVDNFTNDEIALADLPRASAVKLNPLAKNFHFTALVMWGLTVLLVAAVNVIIIIASDQVELATYKSEITLAVLALMVFCAWWNIRELKSRGYAIRAHDVIYKKGLVWQRTQVVPYVRVQHVETHRGPIERLFGLSSLKIFTAGGMTADMIIPGLKVAVASSLRSSILRSVTIEAGGDAETGNGPENGANSEIDGVLESDRAFAGETKDD